MYFQQYPLLAVVGQVGAGKSSLLQCLLGELKLLDGSIEMKGRISYASQEVMDLLSYTKREHSLWKAIRSRKIQHCSRGMCS